MEMICSVIGRRVVFAGRQFGQIQKTNYLAHTVSTYCKIKQTCISPKKYRKLVTDWIHVGKKENFLPWVLLLQYILKCFPCTSMRPCAEKKRTLVKNCDMWVFIVGGLIKQYRRGGCNVVYYLRWDSGKRIHAAYSF